MAILPIRIGAGLGVFDIASGHHAQCGEDKYGK